MVRRTMAIYPMWKGIAFAVVDDRLRHLEQGITRFFSKNDDEFLIRLDALVEKHKPHGLVVEDFSGTARKRRARVSVRIAAEYARTHDMPILTVSGLQVAEFFGASKQREIAKRLCQAFPNLTPLMPPVRKRWESEGGRPAVFKAIAMAVVVQ